MARAGATNCAVRVGVPSAVLYESARQQQIRYGLFSLLAIAFAVAAALLIERSIVRPVLRLREAARDLGAGFLGCIGFTMSIFITSLAFAGEGGVINSSKMAILLASLTAGTVGFLWLKLLGKPVASDDDMNTMDFEATEA